MQNIKMNDHCLLESLVEKYGAEGVENAINKLNENIDTTKLPLYFGISEIYFIDYGRWYEPDLLYKNYVCNCLDVEDSMFQYMKECIADGEDWGDPNNDDDFCKFCQAHANKIKRDIIKFSMNY